VIATRLPPAGAGREGREEGFDVVERTVVELTELAFDLGDAVIEVRVLLHFGLLLTVRLPNKVSAT
jgi:hypothetical protein